jgi:hypothetical protein
MPAAFAWSRCFVLSAVSVAWCAQVTAAAPRPAQLQATVSVQHGKSPANKPATSAHALGGRSLQGRSLNLHALAAPLGSSGYARVAETINSAHRPQVAAAPPPQPGLLSDLANIEKGARNLGVDMVTTLASPFARLDRTQAQYFSERLIEAVSGQNVRFYESRW